MRFLPSLLLSFVVASGVSFGQTPPVSVVSTIPDQSIVQPVRVPAIDLRSFFTVPATTGQVVQFNTSLGTFYVEMKTAAAPNTVSNFLSYVNANSYTNTIIHRLDKPLGILQGGGFHNDGNLSAVATNAPIALETSDTLNNTRGTVAMARTGAPDSATSEWFVNFTDNTLSLPPASASGYAVFGQVIGSGMKVVDAIAARPVPAGTLTVTSSSTSSVLVTVDASTLPANFGQGWGLLGSTVQSISGNFVTLVTNASATIAGSTTVPWTRFGDPFTQLPVLTPLPVDNTVLLSNLVNVNSVASVGSFPGTEEEREGLTFTAQSSNPGLINAIVSGNNLYATAAKNLAGSGTITVTATDPFGNSAQTSFNVTASRQVRDYNSDGKADFLFQNNAGQLAAWYLDNTGTATFAPYLYTGGLYDYRVVATADMNGDGVADILFQNTVGQVVIWFLNPNGTVSSTATVYGGGLGDFRLVATADINGDGQTDLLFQNTVGQIAVWYMQGITIQSAVYFYGGGLGDWRLVCTADINGDGFADLLFQNTIGQIAVWYLGPTGAVTTATIYSGGALGDYRLVGSADINGDGIGDLTFQNYAGQIAVWFLGAGGGVSSAKVVNGAGLGDFRLR